MQNIQSGKTSLVILAAGLSSRFSGGIKQLEPVGRHGEIIMDYSVHDAIEAGFNKIIFIIRKDIRDIFMERIGRRMEAVCEKLNVEIAYAYQELSDLPEGFVLPEGRTKPWGTGQAVLACKDLLKEPFAVINADDYYGKSSFVKLHKFLYTSEHRRTSEFSMAGFVLKNTLSEFGGVTRGICQVNANGYLEKIKETPNVEKKPDGVWVENRQLNEDSYVSMNMWGLTPFFLELLEDGFVQFLKEVDENPLKAEFLIPIFMEQLLQEKKVTVKVLETQDKWFGVTYQEDKAFVVEAFKELTEAGVYREDLFSDLR